VWRVQLVRDRAPLARWCALAVAPAAAYAVLTLTALSGIDCDVSLDPQRFCVWWSHSRLPTTLGIPAVLAFGCYASLERESRRPVTFAAVLVVLTCAYLRAAAAPVLY
jgi:hypothetical protein